jgi:hypothetical protein
MQGEVKLPYGLRNGSMIHIREVQRGINCGCVCPACGERLVANKGNVRAHHFSHYRTKQCVKAFETTLHKLAKQRIQEKLKIVLPGHDKWLPESEMMQQTPAKIFDLVSVEAEKLVGSVRPDLICHTARGKFFVEIKVTHKVNHEKRNQLVELGIPTLEIDLGRVGKCHVFDALDELLFGEPKVSAWVFHPLCEKARKNKDEHFRRKALAVEAKIREIEEKTRGVWTADQLQPPPKYTGKGLPREATCRYCGAYTIHWTIYDYSDDLCICKQCGGGGYRREQESLW